MSALPSTNRAGWDRRPLGRVTNRSKQSGQPGLQPLSVFLDQGVVPRSSREDNHNRLGADLSNYLVVHPGDIVFNKLRTWQGGLGVSEHTGIVSPAYFVVRPTDGIYSRFFHYVLRSQPYLAELTRLSKFMPPSQFDIAWDDLRQLQVPIPPLSRQRAIAAYLDTETARIDALISKKRRMIELLGERRRVFVSHAVTLGIDNEELRPTTNAFAPAVPRTWRLLTLRHALLRILDTPHKTAPVVDASRYLVVRTANVKKGRLVFTDARYTDRESWSEWNRRAEPRPGDVMFTREAPAGEACLVPSGQELCIGQRMVLFQVDEQVVSGEWLVHSIYSGSAQRFIEVMSNSTTVAHLNMSDIPDIPIAVPPLLEQRRILTAIAREVDRDERVSRALGRQISLLAEHRQALITAAVTGELDIPGAA